MTAAVLIRLAADAGLTITTNAGRLHWQSSRPPPAELLAELAVHKLEIIEALTAPPPASRVWLDKVAELLACSPDYLLAHRFIDRRDLLEQYTMHPQFAARLIRSNPAWTKPPLVDHPSPDHLPAGDTPEAELIADDHPRHIIHAAATASPEWIAARDDYHNHIFGCRDCYAPLSRYCATGADLRLRYDQTPIE